MPRMRLGEEDVVWDEGAPNEYRKRGRGRLRARFAAPAALAAQFKREIDAAGKINPKLEATVFDQDGLAIARVTKVLSIRRKDRKTAATAPTNGARA